MNVALCLLMLAAAATGRPGYQQPPDMAYFYPPQQQQYYPQQAVPVWQQTNIPNRPHPWAGHAEHQIFKQSGLSGPSLPPKLPSLTNLPTPPIPLPAEDCITEGGEMGECLTAQQCGAGGGELGGLCHQGMDSSGYPRVCCTFSSSCGTTTGKAVSYFRSPDWPNPTHNHSDCSMEFTVSPGVCQVRLDYLEFEVGQVLAGQCSPTDQMTVMVSDSWAVVPHSALCGSLGSHHQYIHLPDPALDTPAFPNSRPTSISLQAVVSSRPSKWNIRVTQIHCDGAGLQAPAGCSQYYNQLAGSFSSHNYRGRSLPASHAATACIRLDQAACAIEYRLDLALGSGPKLKYGLTCSDYLAFTGERSGLCGQAAGRVFVLPVRGQQGVTLTTDTQAGQGEVGFNLAYKYHHNCTRLQFHQYPQPRL